MASISFSSGDETAETADGQNYKEFKFEISKLSQNDDKFQDIETKESDEHTNMNSADIDPSTPDKDYGYSVQNPRKTLANIQPGGNIVRDGMMKARPDVFEDNYDLEDDRAAETNKEADNTVINHNNAGERDATASLTSDVASSSNNLIHEEGILSSRPTKENEEETNPFFPEQANISNLPKELTPNADTCKCSQDENFAEQEVICSRYNHRALPKDAETYKLETFEKNAMIIFNQKHIIGYEKPRDGTEKDVDKLKQTFSQFGFDIDPHDDLPRDKIFEKLDKFSKEDYTDYGCIAVVILTHGSDQGLLCAKKGWDEEFNETDIIDYFRTSLNETLVTKPILFIIQACRGTEVSKSKQAGKRGMVKQDSHKDKDQSYTLPIESDMLVLHSTYPKKVSHRNSLHGSWFIQTLCDKINQLSGREDLESIITASKREVAIDMEHFCRNRKTCKYEINKQMPIAMSTLIRKLFLTKYKGCIPKSITKELESQVDGCCHNSGIDDAESVTDKKRIGNPGPTHTDWSSYFDYLKGMLQHFLEDPCNSEDSIARNYLNLASTFKDSANFHESKKEMLNLMTEHLAINAKHFEYYKFIYLNNFAVAVNVKHSSLNTETNKNDINKQIPATMLTLMTKLFFWRYESCIPKSMLLQPPTCLSKSETQDDGCNHNGSIDEERIGNPGPFHPDWSSYFSYLKGILQHFLDDPCNSEDHMAKSYLRLASTFKNSAEFHESKEEISKIISEHLKKNAKHLEYYKFLYLNDFAEI